MKRRAEGLIVSTTITGNREQSIREAIASVAPMVAKVIVIDTGITDHTLAVAREAAGNKLVVREFPWVDDFAAARNFALQAAEEAGAQWAVTVDSDEILYPKPTFDLRSALVDKGLKILFAPAADDSYAKERVIKLGAGVHWVGPTHEYTRGATLEEQYLTTNLKFGERPKTMAQMRHKLERDLRLLRRCVELEPRNPRWFYYLGGTCQNFGMHEEAIGHFLRCLELQSWVAEGAMAGDRIGHSYAALRRFDEAIALYRRELLKDPTKVQLLHLIKVMEGKRAKAATLPSPS